MSMDEQNQTKEAGEPMIPVYEPLLKGNERKYVDECLDSGWISSKGRFVSEFENRFAEYVGVRYATAVSNGTVALHLALVALGIGPGDEVIVPTLTYIASVNAIRYTGATPVFVDSCMDTWQMDPEDVRAKMTERTKAIMIVHIYGHPCNMDGIMTVAHERGLFVVEDCAEAFGSTYHGHFVGTFGDVAAFSFYGNKTITTGEGGMVITNDEALHERVVHYKGQGLANGREYWHDVIGYNYRMTNICAAIGVAQLERADQILAAKRQIADWYAKALAGTRVTMLREIGDVRSSYWMCSILVSLAEEREPLRAVLLAGGIETRPVFYPVHTMPMYCDKNERHPIADSIGQRGINLPSGPGLTIDQVSQITDIIRHHQMREL